MTIYNQLKTPKRLPGDDSDLRLTPHYLSVFGFHLYKPSNNTFKIFHFKYAC